MRKAQHHTAQPRGASAKQTAGRGCMVAYAAAMDDTCWAEAELLQPCLVHPVQCSRCNVIPLYPVPGSTGLRTHDATF